ncbi:MAG: flagellar basal body P-ring protein FlgI [Chitinispirillaceae bacterium]|nr:flagellar basal body P-ring protein FlgI [Chitinispirillaceae bacterium]
MGKKFTVVVTVMALLVGGVSAQQMVRIKDVAALTGIEDVQLFGYGLVVGLAGTGDRSQTIFTEQTVTNMLKNMGIELPEKRLRLRNVASVMVTGTLRPFKRRGTRFDVTVSSMGDATSLEGGTLILTPLQGPDGEVYASGQGPLATGGYDIRDRGMSYVKKNHVLVGRIPDGAIVQQEYTFNLLDGKDISLSLSSPDFTSALQLAETVNNEFSKNSGGIRIARPLDAATVSLDYHLLSRDSVRNYIDLITFISRVENLSFAVASIARVVVNERTGTIVAGGDVKISSVAVTHGGVKIEVKSVPEVIQPPPFSLGRTEVIPNPQVAVEEKEAEMVVLDGTTTVSDLSYALNSLGVSPRDVIAIFQAIKEAGALHAQLMLL